MAVCLYVVVRVGVASMGNRLNLLFVQYCAKDRLAEEIGLTPEARGLYALTTDYLLARGNQLRLDALKRMSGFKTRAGFTKAWEELQAARGDLGGPLVMLERDEAGDLVQVEWVSKALEKAGALHQSHSERGKAGAAAKRDKQPPAGDNVATAPTFETFWEIGLWRANKDLAAGVWNTVISSDAKEAAAAISGLKQYLAVAPTTQEKRRLDRPDFFLRQRIYQLGPAEMIERWATPERMAEEFCRDYLTRMTRTAPAKPKRKKRHGTSN